jgi:serine/threonine protein phosphatase PrpC
LTAPMPHPTETAHALVQAALAGGGEDNVSVIVAQVSKVTGLSRGE